MSENRKGGDPTPAPAPRCRVWGIGFRVSGSTHSRLWSFGLQHLRLRDRGNSAVHEAIRRPRVMRPLSAHVATLTVCSRVIPSLASRLLTRLSRVFRQRGTANNDT